MEILADFGERLHTSLDAFCWAMEQLPRERWLSAAPRHPDQWPAARHAFHLAYYERHLALPSMRQWTGGAMPTSHGPVEDAAVKDAAWRDAYGAHDLPALLDDVRAVRAEQMVLLTGLANPATLDEHRVAIWGVVTLRWVVTKTLQHTFEHTHDVLRMALWWDVM